MAPHVAPRCILGDKSCISVGNVVGIVLISIVLIAISALVAFWILRKRQKHSKSDKSDDNEHGKHPINGYNLRQLGLKQLELLKLPQAHTMPRNIGSRHQNNTNGFQEVDVYAGKAAHAAQEYAPRSSADLWKKRGWDFSKPSAKASPSTAPRVSPIQEEDTTHPRTPTLRKSLEELFGTPIADSSTSPGPSSSRPRPSPYQTSDQRPSMQSPTGECHATSGSVAEETVRGLDSSPTQPRPPMSSPGKTSRFKEHITQSKDWDDVEVADDARSNFSDSIPAHWGRTIH